MQAGKRREAEGRTTEFPFVLDSPDRLSTIAGMDPEKTQRDETELLTGCLRGDRKSWCRLVDRCAPYFTWLIRRKVPPSRVRRGMREEDLLQECFLELLKEDCAALRRFDGRSSLDSYLRGLAVHVILDRLETEERRRRLLSNLPSNEETFAELSDRLEEEETGETLRSAMDRLKERERLLLRWIRVENMEYREAARLLRISPNSVGPLLQRAEERLRGLLDAK